MWEGEGWDGGVTAKNFFYDLKRRKDLMIYPIHIDETPMEYLLEEKRSTNLTTLFFFLSSPLIKNFLFLIFSFFFRSFSLLRHLKLFTKFDL